MIDEKSAVAVVGCAEMLDIHVTTLYRWEKQNYLIPIRIGTKVRYRKSDIVPDPYYLDKKVKMVELFPYHKLGLMNKYTHLFGDS